MALLKLKLAALRFFGKFPETEEVEAKDKALREEFEEYNGFSESNDFKRYLALKDFVKSGEVERVKKELQALKYPNSPEFTKEQEFKKLSKSSAIKNYFALANSEKLATYKSINLTGKPTRFNELKLIVESTDYKSKRKLHKKDNSDEYQKELEYLKLKKDPQVKQYFNLKKWKPLKDYFELENSDTIAQFNELKDYISSNDFIEQKNYLLSKNKFQHSKTYKELQEFEALKKSEKIVWYLSLQNTKKFDEIKRWEQTFIEQFTEKTLDSSKWITRYFWGDALLNKSYSLASDKHWYTDKSNLDLTKGNLKITTRSEAAEGIAWDLRYGFVPKSFNYTSGIISTGQVFRQKHGRFEAKVKMAPSPGIYHAFWLVGDTMIPHIDVFRLTGNKMQASIFWQNGQNNKIQKSISNIGGLKFDSNYYIFSIDWSPTKITWKVNGIPFKEATSNLPEDPMYLVISSGVISDADNSKLPVTLEVDWVRCWKETESLT